MNDQRNFFSSENNFYELILIFSFVARIVFLATLFSYSYLHCSSHTATSYRFEGIASCEGFKIKQMSWGLCLQL